ncbi:ABC transporter permease subunit [Anderseniella sp. Alg231-50]|uniref:ABC transporter permease subunit n=1 Tax=Anderseniella sp. Alg231-50 TaxID=1922226 RepID=UPI000D55106C
MSAILTIAQAEIRIGIRNRWVLLASIILLVFALLLALLGSAPSGATKADGLSVVVASLSTLSVYLVPLIALLLSFDAIAGEIDRGTLQLTLATPVSRGQVLFGKFCGHVIVLSLAVVLGYGVAGTLVFAAGQNTGMGGIVDLARVIATSLALGATFIAIGYVASVSVRQTGTAAALAVAIWLFAVVLYDLALLGGLLASPDGFFAKVLFPYLLLLNPADAFRVFNMAAIDAATASTGLAAGGSAMPFLPQLAIISPFVWMVIALGLSTAILGRVQP